MSICLSGVCLCARVPRLAGTITCLLGGVCFQAWMSSRRNPGSPICLEGA